MYSKTKLLVAFFVEDLCDLVKIPQILSRIKLYDNLLIEYSNREEYTADVLSAIPAFHSLKSKLSGIANKHLPPPVTVNNLGDFDVPDELGNLNGYSVILGRVVMYEAGAIHGLYMCVLFNF